MISPVCCRTLRRHWQKAFQDDRDEISLRTRLNRSVFTSTDYREKFDIALHNEFSYSTKMPVMFLVEQFLLEQSIQFKCLFNDE